MQPQTNDNEEEFSPILSIKEIIEKDDSHLLKEVLTTYPVLVEMRDLNQRTPAHDAAEYGSWGCLGVLKEFGADLNATDVLGQTPLHRSLTRQRSDSTDWLIKEGVNLNISDAFGITPILIAAMWRNDMVSFLAERGADPTAVDKKKNGIGEWAHMGAKQAAQLAIAKKYSF